MNDCGLLAELVLAVRTRSVHYCSPKIIRDTVLRPPVSVLVCVWGVCGCVGEYSIHICMVFVRSPQIICDTVLRPPVSVLVCVWGVWMCGWG